MSYHVVPSEFNNDFANFNKLNQNTSSSEKYFNVNVQSKSYPSCYQYNVLIMLAKRLLKEENERINPCKIKNSIK